MVVGPSIRRLLRLPCRILFVRKEFEILLLLVPFWILHLVCGMKREGCIRLVEEEHRLLYLDPVCLLEIFVTKRAK